MQQHDFDSRFADIELTLKESSEVASSIGSTTSTNVPSSKKQFVADFVEIKDFTLDYKSRKGALTSKQCSEYIKQAKHDLEKNVVDLIDWDKTESEPSKRVLSTTNCIYLKKTLLNKENGYFLKDEIVKYTKEQRINERQLKVVLQPDPDKKPMYRAIATACSYFRKMVSMIGIQKLNLVIQ